MIDVYLDKSRALRLRARVGEASVPRVFKFYDSDGAPHDISEYDFKLFVFIRPNSSRKLFTLSIGDGMTIQGDGNNELLIEISNERAQQNPDTYFFRLYSAEQDHTWLNGPFEFNDGESHVGFEEGVASSTIADAGFDYSLDFVIQ